MRRQRVDTEAAGKKTRRKHAGGAPTPAPLWYKNAVIYQLHVRSFCDSTGDGVGDFNGLVSKLDYLADLGVTAIWLLPFYPSPLKDDGYDIGDYTGVHRSYGSMDDVKRFIQEAHARDLKVITELVVNHTSDQHPWFQRARRAPKGSAERNFYVWSDTPEKYSGVRIIFKDFETSNWAWDAVAGQYFWHRFYSHQPDLNFENPAVHRAVIDVCDFWMNLGVDGMRLDAVPYLYEQEGTSCENLEPTHGFLKKLRAHVDKKFPGRMLLAEANQWPEDAIAYFGSGDECHMAFHFPLMPRLFMSVRMEDRHPIIDILEQTPPIPNGAQWAMFLRNHDELTLEMVTDEERDYMYRVYATDREARINLGIRRRLAPLLSNSRRKIELMNALLFSLPGTPVIYYGDEIGMGDNVHLGDRNGVRTPMQWSGDRNAGFSRANPQRLFLPTIIDPEYHYETLNVESQQANPSSMLWWMKRLIALRKKYTVFGHGELRFLSPENTRVLAFLRRHADQTVLVVANLSRFVQPVSLDLSEYSGWHVTEMMGKVKFPAVKTEPYFLSLGPHGFYWFVLEPAHAAAAGATVAAAPVVRVADRPGKVLTPGASVRALEEVLPTVLPQTRWFAAKARTLRSVKIVDRIIVPQPGTSRGSRVIALLRCEYAEGEPEQYALPLGIEARKGHDPHAATLITVAEAAASEEANGTSATSDVYDIFDGMSDGEFARALVAVALEEKEVPGERVQLGGVKLEPTMRAQALAAMPARIPKVEQSNSTAIFGDSIIFKLFRRLDSGGENPEVEVGRHLTARVGFPHAVPLVAVLQLLDGRGQAETLGVALKYVPSQGDAWGWMLDQMVKYLERAAALGPSGADAAFAPPPGDHLTPARPPASLVELIGEPVEAARLLGVRTAEMHSALADDRGDPAFTAEPLTLLDQRSIMQSLRNTVRHTLALLAKAPVSEKPALQALVTELRGSETRLLASLRPLASTRTGGMRIRLHGDLHLGQVLRSGGDFIFIDFEGEPMRSIGERRLKRTALKDVAGMIRSFDYAAWAGVRKFGEMFPPAPGASVNPVIATAAAACSAWLSRVFVTSYMERIAELNPALLGSNRAGQALLLRTCLLEKSLTEVAYDLNSRPDWAEIPLRAVVSFLNGDGSEGHAAAETGEIA